MDFLNKAADQVKDLLRSMSPSARITAVLLAGVIVVSLVYLFAYRSPSPDQFLLGGRAFSPSDIEAMEVAFGKAKLSGYEVHGARVKIPTAEKYKYLAALAEGNALPADFGKYFAEAVESSSPFESRRQREQRIKNANQQALAYTISSMNGIDKAMVKYDVVEQAGFPRRKEFTAMVAVKPSGSGDLDSQRIRSIKKLVSRAIAGLSEEAVAVTDLNTGRTFSGAPDGLATAEDDPYVARKAKYEEEWTEKITEKLPPIEGLVVGVNVELDRETSYEEVKTDVNPKTVPIKVSDTSQSSVNEKPTPGGRPGVVTNNSGANNPASVRSGGVAKSTSEKTTSEQLSRTSDTRTAVSRAALTPNYVSVSVLVPSNYYEKVYREKWLAANPDKKPEDMPKSKNGEIQSIEVEVKNTIENVVEKLIPRPPQAGDNPQKPIRVATYQYIPPPEIQPPSTPITVLGWLGRHWKSIGMMLVGVIGLLLLRGMVRSASSADARSEATSATTTGAATPREETASDAAATSPVAEETEEYDEEGRLRRNLAGPNLKNDLTDLVREDPDAAVNILRNWINSAM